MEGNEVRRDSPHIVGAVGLFCMYGSAQWLEYERRKADWQTANPLSTPVDYQAAMRRIALELEV